jgi:hypothetical protein
LVSTYLYNWSLHQCNVIYQITRTKYLHCIGIQGILSASKFNTFSTFLTVSLKLYAINDGSDVKSFWITPGFTKYKFIYISEFNHAKILKKINATGKDELCFPSIRRSQVDRTALALSYFGLRLFDNSRPRDAAIPIMGRAREK